MKTLVGLLLLLLSSQAFSWASETSDDKWRSGWGQGWAEAEVTHGSGNRIYLACESGSAMPSSITFELVGRGPPPRSEVLLIFDKGNPEGFQVDERGRITADCRACAANFEDAVQKLKSHSTVYVRFIDKRESTFTLNGSTQAIGACKPGWP